MKICILFIACFASIVLAEDLPEISVDDFRQEWFTQLVDHYNYMDTRTYQQRYWVNDKYYDQENGPVFIYICGEYTCSVPSTRLYPFMVGAENNALLLVLEHRYYGESQLFDNWESENFKYLSAEQALSDLAYFIHQFNQGIHARWVVIGGSYPGALSAWFRARYPHAAVASWASSAVVQPIVDFTEFDKQIYTSTMKSGEFCPAAIQRITNYVSQTFKQAMAGEGSELAQQILEAFDAPSMRYDDFMFFFADIFVISVQYGGRTSLCDLMNQIKDLPDFDQLAPIKEQAASVDVAPQDYCSTKLQDTTIDFGKSGRQWTFQYCTQYGFFQTPDLDTPMRSDLIDLPFWYQYCSRIFPEFYLQPIDQQVETEFAGFPISGTQTFYVNGGEDPWQWAGIRESNDKLSQIARVADCNDCGHCVELYTPDDSDPQEVVQIREEIRTWLRDILNPEQTF